MTSTVLRLIASFMFGALSMASAATAPTVLLEEMTAPELAREIRGGKTIIIVPIGGTEQNGPHMTLGKHNVRVKALSERIARALGNAVVAPVIAYVPEGGIDPPTGHMRHPGTITVPSDAYRTVLEYAARSFRLHGFRDIVFLGDSGDYQRDNVTVAKKLNLEWKATPVRAHAIAEYYRVPTTWFAQALKNRGYAGAEIGPHAGLADTSLMLAVEPRVVRTDRFVPDPGQTSLSGVTGDPRRATSELGALAADEIVRQSVAAIRAATIRP